MRKLEPDARDAVHAAARIEAEATRNATIRAAAIEREARERAAADVARIRADAEATAADLVAAAHAEAARVRSRDEGAIVDIVREALQTVLARETELGKTVVIDIVRQAMRKLGRARRFVVRVHPHDVESLRAAGVAVMAPSNDAQAWDIVGDADIARGGAVIETEIGTIDARLATQIESIVRAMRGSSA